MLILIFFFLEKKLILAIFVLRMNLYDFFNKKYSKLSFIFVTKKTPNNT